MTLNCKSPGNLWFPFLNSINWVDKVSSKRTHVSNYVIQTLERAYNLSTWQQYFPLFLGLGTSGEITGYDDFVDVSRQVMKGRSPSQQKEAVREVLLSILPPGAPAAVLCSPF